MDLPGTTPNGRNLKAARPGSPRRGVSGIEHLHHGTPIRGGTPLIAREPATEEKGKRGYQSCMPRQCNRSPPKGRHSVSAAVSEVFP